MLPRFWVKQQGSLVDPRAGPKIEKEKHENCLSPQGQRRGRHQGGGSQSFHGHEIQ